MAAQNFLKLATAAAALGFSGLSLAASVVVSGVTPYPYVTTNTTLYGQSYANEISGEVSLVEGGNTYAAYCVELNQGVTIGETVNYDKVSFSNDAYSRLFAVAGLNSLATGADAVDTADEWAGLQLAIWEATYDGLGGSISTGNFTITGSSSATAVAMANSYLSAAAALQSWQYTPTTLVRYTNPTKQDFMASMGSAAAVPEPEETAMLLAGLGALLVMAQRRKLKI